MKASVRWLLVALCALLAATTGAWADAERPLAAFLDAQGTTSVFVPPVPDYVGWADEDFVTFALVDYAGLANAWLEAQTGGRASLGTTVSGVVKERRAPDGRAEVRVKLEARNALSWAFPLADIGPNDPLPFLNTPLTFGARAQDVVAGAKAALGKASLDITFMNPAPGAPFPDLVQLVNAPDPAQLPIRFKFQSKACGLTSDGTPAQLEIRQTCTDDGTGQVCAKAVVDIRRNKCGSQVD